MKSYFTREGSILLLASKNKFCATNVNGFQCNKCVTKGEGGGGRGEDSPHARLKQVQFALNKKHAFFNGMP